MLSPSPARMELHATLNDQPGQLSDFLNTQMWAVRPRATAARRHLFHGSELFWASRSRRRTTERIRYASGPINQAARRPTPALRQAACKTAPGLTRRPRLPGRELWQSSAEQPFQSSELAAVSRNRHPSVWMSTTTAKCPFQSAPSEEVQCQRSTPMYWA